MAYNVPEPIAGDIRAYGAKADGTTDNTSALAAAKSAGMSRIHFPYSGSGVYYFNGNADLTGITITADPGVSLSVANSLGVLYGNIKCGSDVTLINRGKGKTVVLPRTDPTRFLGVGRANFPTSETYTSKAAIDLSGVTPYIYTHDYSVALASPGTSPTQSAEEFRCDVASGGSAKFLGLTVTPQVGHYYEVSIFSAASSSSGQAYVVALDSINSDMRGIEIMDDSNSFATQAYEVNSVRATAGASWAREDRFNMPGAEWVLGNAASVLAGIYVASATEMEFYVNRQLVKRWTMPTAAADNLFWGMNAAYAFTSATSGMWYGVDYTGKPQFLTKRRSLKIGLVGDSLTAGSGMNLRWQDFLPEFLNGSPGIGYVDTQPAYNIAVSGDKVADQLVDVQNTDWSTFDVVCVLIGTNDIVAGTATTTFRSTLGDLCDEILSDNPEAKIVLGLPPMFRTTNSIKGGRIRSAVAHLAASEGYGLADPLAALGGLFDDLMVGDNIHPDIEGVKAIAASFAAEIARIYKDEQADDVN